MGKSKQKNNVVDLLKAIISRWTLYGTYVGNNIVGPVGGTIIVPDQKAADRYIHEYPGTLEFTTLAFLPKVTFRPGPILIDSEVSIKLFTEALLEIERLQYEVRVLNEQLGNKT